ncbi:MAG: choice-of-anchor J domain-containing protein [Crocinitomicaceae bacterium]|nr:choice-of-anchor J domain-containing protein [Crocinitomicaceae bacterium]MDG1777238.1 choice-of-anchor J domain-containing protein [Crocinitomicaceae bacterium]
MIKKTTLAIALLCGFYTSAQTEVYFEDFQPTFPVTYTVVDNDGLTPNAAVSEYTDAWIFITDPFDTSNTNIVASSTSYFEPTGQADRWLITPAIVLGAFGNSASWKAQSHDPSFPDGYYVLVSGTDTQLSSFTDTLAYVYGEVSDSLHFNEANISDLGFDNQTIHLAFVNRTVDGFKLSLDDIRVTKDDPAALIEPGVQVSIYPNPTSDFITIKGLQSIHNIQVISLDGKVLVESTASKIDITHLDAGNYICLIQGDGKVSQSSIVKL